MYLCLWEYISIQYSDGTTLWDTVFQAATLQQDLFNTTTKSHLPEYPGMSTTFKNDASSDEALQQLMSMINGITDQGEGCGVVAEIQARLKLLQRVKEQFQPDKDALETDYPSYTDSGKKKPKAESADAAARSGFGKMDHFETFSYVMTLVDEIGTWDLWHAQGHMWTADMLESGAPGPYNDILPSTASIAAALNNLKAGGDNNYTLLSQASAGSIAGVTTVLNTFWSTPGAPFPYPAMSGTGDRMAMCWAIFGKAPDLSIGVVPQQPNIMYNACQGLSLSGTETEICANIAAYHTCISSNTCMAQGGCGFINTVNGGSGCSSRLTMLQATDNKKDAPAGDSGKVQNG